MEQFGVKGLGHGRNSEVLLPTLGLEPVTFWSQALILTPWAPHCKKRNTPTYFINLQRVLILHLGHGYISCVGVTLSSHFQQECDSEIWPHHLKCVQPAALSVSPSSPLLLMTHTSRQDITEALFPPSGHTCTRDCTANHDEGHSLPLSFTINLHMNDT